jgi:DNA invertase Pin-like site-specific DNA recombinase
MTEEATLIRNLRRAAKRREDAAQAKRAAAANLRDRVRDAHDAGVNVTLIAKEAGLSRQAVYDLLEDQQPS